MAIGNVRSIKRAALKKRYDAFVYEWCMEHERREALRAVLSPDDPAMPSKLGRHPTFKMWMSELKDARNRRNDAVGTPVAKMIDGKIDLSWDEEDAEKDSPA